jgi:ATP-dependent DNA helicase RecG
LGTHAALGRLLSQAEVIFEYRSSPRPGPANQREEFWQGFLLFYDRIWDLVNLRNDIQHFQERLVMHPVPTFSEIAVREALLNAVSHRDYRHAGSVFVRQFPRRIEIVSPGGFPPGITPENILDQQLPRNRRIADTFARCGLIERSGQGADRIVEECVRHGQPLPDYSRSDPHQVWLTLHGEIRDENFLKFLERLGPEALAALDPHDFLILGLVAVGKKVPNALKPRLSHFVETGVFDRIARGKVILARRYYETAKPPKTAEREAARHRNLGLLLERIEKNRATGTTLKELLEVLPALTRDQVKTLLKQLRGEGKVTVDGGSKNARWYPASRSGFGSENSP